MVQFDACHPLLSSPIKGEEYEWKRYFTDSVYAFSCDQPLKAGVYIAT